MIEVAFNPCYQHDPKVFSSESFVWHCNDCFNNAVQEHKCKDFYFSDTKDCELCWLAEK